MGYDLLAQALADCGRDGYTGGLRVSGSPGGGFRLRNGLVIGAESPGAPGPEALLLRSGRVSGEQWADAVRESGGARWPAEALIAGGLAGAAELRVVTVMALHDAAFAIVAGQVDGVERDDRAGPPDGVTVSVGEGSLRLLQDANRKLAAVAALPHPVHPDRERPRPGRPAERLTSLQTELLTHADGRRTARDLAFLSGRGVYTVTVEVARMLGEGLLECGEAPPPIPVRVPEATPVRHREPPPPPPPPEPIHTPVTLPRRVPGASGMSAGLPPEKPGGSWRGFFRLRNGTAR
ncbi:MarR family transcriptional regulator [Streptomyces mangrovisoli]|uniref:MarR family transcriptional regulator n=1 Tax=Streptomyces mangrovisoli TaxID=1428628 RepID=UPI0030B820A4